METVQRYLPQLMVDVVRLCVWLALLMIVFIPLEKLAAVHPRNIVRKNFGRDVSYYFLNSLLPKLLLLPPLTAIAWALHSVVPSGLHAWVAEMPLWGRFAAALVVGEIGFYWGHRWMHEIPFLWRFHALHHSAEEVDWLVNTHAHPLDLVFTRLCGFLPLYITGLAQPLIRNKVDIVPLLIVLVGTVWGFFIHSNIRWRFGWFESIISTPMFHHWHHTNDEHINKNYSSMLPWLDRIFGTWYVPQNQWPTKYGTDTPMADSFAGQLIQPLVPEPDFPLPNLEQ